MEWRQYKNGRFDSKYAVIDELNRLANQYDVKFQLKLRPTDRSGQTAICNTDTKNYDIRNFNVVLPPEVDTDNSLRRCRVEFNSCLLYTSPSPRDRTRSRMP